MMEVRATALVDAAVAAGERCVGERGVESGATGPSAEWLRAARIVAAYRDRYRIVADGPVLGAPAVMAAQRLDEARAAAAAREDRRIAANVPASPEARGVAGERRALAL